MHHEPYWRCWILTEQGILVNIWITKRLRWRQGKTRTQSKTATKHMSQHLSPKTKLSLLYKWFHTCESSRVTQDIANSVTWVLHLESEILKSVDGKVPRALAHLLHRLSPKGHHAPPCSLCKKYICAKNYMGPWIQSWMAHGTNLPEANTEIT